MHYFHYAHKYIIGIVGQKNVVVFFTLLLLSYKSIHTDRKIRFLFRTLFNGFNF
nr:Uncharacterised protein [Klebsiella pneumoniae]